MIAFCPEHPKCDQNPKFTPLSETISIPTAFHMRSSLAPPPPPPTRKTALLEFETNKGTLKCFGQKLITSKSVGVVCKLSLWNFEVEGSLTLN